MNVQGWQVEPRSGRVQGGPGQDIRDPEGRGHSREADDGGVKPDQWQDFRLIRKRLRDHQREEWKLQSRVFSRGLDVDWMDLRGRFQQGWPRAQLVRGSRNSSRHEPEVPRLAWSLQIIVWTLVSVVRVGRHGYPLVSSTVRCAMSISKRVTRPQSNAKSIVFGGVGNFAPCTWVEGLGIAVWVGS